MLCLRIYLLLLVTTLTISSFAKETTVECQARVSSDKAYAVELNFSDRFLRIKDDKGFIAQGNATYAFSQAEKTHRFLLGISLSSSVQVDIESEGKERIALCLSKNECYPCSK